VTRDAHRDDTLALARARSAPLFDRDSAKNIRARLFSSFVPNEDLLQLNSD
tara:strand:- start:308 stop:460 length:153 start_codon:yes stop_codon:yes gene_type:complete